MDCFGSLSFEGALDAACVQKTPTIAHNVAQAGRPIACLSKREQEILELGIGVLRLGVERGDVDIAGWLLERNPEFMGILQSAGTEEKQAVEEVGRWLKHARAFEDRNGSGSMLKPEHPVNLKLAKSRQKQEERAKEWATLRSQVCT